MASYERRVHLDRESFVLKFALAGGMFGLLATTIGDIAAGIVLFGAVGAVLEWTVRKIIRPLVRLSGELQRLPAWMKHTDGELADIKAGAVEAAKRAEDAMNIARAVAREVGATARGQSEE